MSEDVSDVDGPGFVTGVVRETEVLAAVEELLDLGEMMAEIWLEWKEGETEIWLDDEDVPGCLVA